VWAEVKLLRAGVRGELFMKKGRTLRLRKSRAFFVAPSGNELLKETVTRGQQVILEGNLLVGVLVNMLMDRN
jgi:RNase P/RNase MRP subunit p29